MPISKVLLYAAMTVSVASTACIKKSGSSAEAAKAMANAGHKDESQYLDSVMDVIKTIDYLPFWNWSQGCGERADSMGYELTAAGLPWHTLVVTPTPGNTIWPVANIPQRVTPIPVGQRSSWKFHVGLVYHTGATDTVIDPSMAADPIALDDWLTAIGTDRSKVTFRYSDAQKDDSFQVLGDEQEMLVTAAKMHELSNYDGETPADTTEIQREIAKLDSRMPQLAEALIKAGKLTPSDDPDNTVTAKHIAESSESNAD